MHTEMFLIRHGETVWNAESRFQGHQDSPLTPRGIAQAEAAAEYLRSPMLAALYSSDLPRTLQTADPIAPATRLAIVPEPALRERNLGIFEGLTREEIAARYAEELSRYAERDPEYVVPNGESLRQLHQRGLDVMERLARRHLGESVAVVSHGALAHHLLAPPQWHPPPPAQPLCHPQRQRQPHPLRPRCRRMDSRESG